MISMARAQQLLQMTAVLQVIFFAYFLLEQGDQIHRPSPSGKIYLGLGAVFMLAAQWYARWVMGKWKKAEDGSGIAARCETAGS
jgi:hypothetical protein